MMKKSLLTALVSGAMALSTVAFAETPAPATTAPAQNGMMGHHMITPDVKPAVSMADAVAAAEKAGDAQARGAMLRQGPNGLVWNVMLQKKDGKPLMSVVDAKTGKIVQTRDMGKEGCPMMEGKPHHGHMMKDGAMKTQEQAMPKESSKSTDAKQ